MTRPRRSSPSTDTPMSDHAPQRAVAFEFYPTPRDTIEMLIRSPLLALPRGHWIDPCVGTARIPSTVNATRRDVYWTLCEIDPRHDDAIRAEMRDVDTLLPFGDFVIREWTLPRADVLIMNPPFSHALAFVEAAFDRAGWVVMLQRSNWFAPARSAWLRKHCPDDYRLPERPSFTGDGKTDMAEYSWFVWPPGDRRRREGRIVMLDALEQPSLFDTLATASTP